MEDQTETLKTLELLNELSPFLPIKAFLWACKTR